MPRRIKRSTRQLGQLVDRREVAGGRPLPGTECHSILGSHRGSASLEPLGLGNFSLRLFPRYWRCHPWVPDCFCCHLIGVVTASLRTY
jgi:hypothetical protein